MSTLWQPWSLRELVDDLAAGRTTARAARERAETRIARTDPQVRAWVTPVAETDASTTGPLTGVPFGVKDIIDVAGHPTRCGSRLRADTAPATEDAAIVRAWRATGADVVGKTVTTEFAFFAPGPTHNPAAPGHTPGGSSSGSAAAVAAGQVPLAIGSQTAGSVTRPAAFCGVASLVMTHGRIPVDGVVGLSPSLDSHGCYAAGVGDLALAWNALTGERPGEAASPRVLLWSAEPFGGVSDAMREAVDTARARLGAAGAVVDALPEEKLVAELAAAHPVVMAYEAARERAAELDHSAQLSAPLRELLHIGAATSEADHAAARATVEAARARIAALFATYDVVLGPAALGAAPAGLDATGDPVLSRAWQALGLPVVTVPGLRDADGLPLGVQAVGPPHGETRLLAHADRIQAALTTPTGKEGTESR
ncbi:MULTISPECIES: amidase [unclassified Streptomyces]|uniref:amidase family protein n=1 Tax=unclassified Streptomyces TaxID=2593676 RepID=UPI00278BC86E|nr:MULTISPECIES: amidase [unclassified Streptomyces]